MADIFLRLFLLFSGINISRNRRIQGLPNASDHHGRNQLTDNEIQVETDDSDEGLIATHIKIIAVGFGRPVTANSETTTMQDHPALSALWDTIVNFDEGDTVTISGPNCNFIFAVNHDNITSAGITLFATAPDSFNTSVTFAHRSIAGLTDIMPLKSPDTGLNGEACYPFFHDMNEPDGHYGISTKAVKRVTIPYGTILSPRILLSAMLKMPSAAIESTIEDLIAELDIRNGNIDDEPETDEPEPEEPSA